MNKKHSQTIVIILITIVFFSCKINNEKYGSYLLNIKPITSYTTDLNSNSSIIFKDSVHNYLVFIKDNAIDFVDIHKDSLVKSIMLPLSINIINSFSAVDTSNFVIYADSFFIQYKNSRFNTINLRNFNDGYITLPYIRIIYFPEIDAIVTAGFPYNMDSIKRKNCGFDFLNVFYLNKLISKRISLQYPKQYAAGKLGIPKVYLSKSDNYLVVSLGIDENMYLVNINSLECKKYIVKSNVSKMNATFPSKGTKREKLDAIMNNELYNDEYQIAYYDELDRVLWRTYKPIMPEKDQRGYYLTGKQSGLILIKFDLKLNQKYEYKLASGQYFMGTNWYYNKYDKTIYHVKLIKNEKNEKTWNPYIYSVFGYNF